MAADFLLVWIKSGEIFAECLHANCLFKLVDCGLDLSLIFVFFGLFLYILTVGLESASLAQVKENASQFIERKRFIEALFCGRA